MEKKIKLYPKQKQIIKDLRSGEWTILGINPNWMWMECDKNYGNGAYKVSVANFNKLLLSKIIEFGETNYILTKLGKEIIID